MDNPTPSDDADPSPSGERAGKPASTNRAWTSAELFGDQQEVLIEHEGQWYRLRRTRAGKLILQK